MSPVERPTELRQQLDRAANQLAGDFAGIFDAAAVREQVLAAVERLPVPKVERYRAVYAARYARDLLRSLARSRGRFPAARPQILFVCVKNAGRSQMAAAFATELSGGRVDALSAGSAPASAIHPEVHDAMREAGIDLSLAFPKPLADEFVRASDAVVTMGCGDACPVIPGKRHEAWDVRDPAGKASEVVRRVRDDVRDRVRRLLESLGVAVEADPRGSGPSRSP